MTEPGQNSENLEPTQTGSTETDATTSEIIGTAEPSGSDAAIAADQSNTTPEDSSQQTASAPQEETTSMSAPDTTTSEPQAEESAGAPVAEPAVGSTSEPPAAVASEPAMSGAPEGGATAEPSGDASAEGSDTSDSEESSDESEPGSRRRGPRGWQPPAMTEERMKEVWDELVANKQSREPVELEVISQNRGGVVTQYKGVEVFVPMSHWTLNRHGTEAGDDAKTGNKVHAHILEMTEFATDARRVTATRRSVLRKSVLESLEIGQRLTGHVSSILDFGIFVDLGGIDGLVHASEISHVRGRHPSEVVKKGDPVEVVIKEIDREKERIYLGMKELLPSPWHEVETKFPEGSVQTGKVVGMTKQGAFVELEPGLDGFIRLRELSWTKRVHHPKDILRKGMDVPVKVLDVSERKQRLSLSYRQAQEDPWPTIAEKYNVGTSWEGEVREISNKGVVVGVDDVEGFLPRGRMGRESKRLPEMKVGEKLNVNVIEVDPKNFSLIFGLPQPEREGGEGRGGGGGEGRGEGRGGGRGRGGDRRDDRNRQAPALAAPKNELKSSDTVTSFALGDMIGADIKKRLGMETEEPANEQQSEEPSTPAPAASASAETATPAGDVQGEQNQESAATATEEGEVVDAASGESGSEEQGAEKTGQE